ncbi:hypothetical protein [Burkholderia sp. Se-20378]|uniref:hypothetical protein n=1 Tax=Burkholderia sp. Se-20378 TaxID=2703899 RepID=UPI0019807E10|nr:hypothetical protein [Burkholderia sp. Se-20378]MBN3770707.1 hypothetical protein [Burkholderia sp. Se-20378]
MATVPALCWICGSTADSGEHLLKASDLRGLFGLVSQSHPLYMHSNAARNVPKRTIKDRAFKSKALLCADCNNAKSQPYDRAWERLSDDLRRRQTLRSGELIKLKNVFKRPAKEALLDTHLYFVKLFGCRIVEHQIPINVRPFADAFLARKAHPYVFIAIGPTPFSAQGKKLAGWSEIHAQNVGGRCVFATWFYHVADVAVNIIYAEPGQNRMGLTQAWHPDSAGRLLRMARFSRVS